MEESHAESNFEIKVVASKTLENEARSSALPKSTDWRARLSTRR